MCIRDRFGTGGNARGNEKDSTVSVFLGSKQIKLVFDGKTIIGHTLAGEFPDYKRVIPSEFKGEAKFNREELLASLYKASAILVDSSSKEQAVKISFSDTSMTLQTSSVDGDTACVELSAKCSSDLPDTGFNSRYIIDVIKVLQTDEALIQIQDASSGVRIIGVDGGEDDYVVMPLRL